MEVPADHKVFEKAMQLRSRPTSPKRPARWGAASWIPKNREKRRSLKIGPIWPVTPQTAHQQLIYGNRRNRLKCKVKFRMDEEERKKPSEAKMRKAEKGGDDVKQ